MSGFVAPARLRTSSFGYSLCVICSSVLGPRFPDSLPELLAYQATIVRVSQVFAGLAWVRYDQAFVHEHCRGVGLFMHTCMGVV